MRSSSKLPVAMGAVMLIALMAGTALAHATYRSSNPGKKASVGSAPSEVWVEFTEQPSQGSTLKIYDPCGERVDSGSYEISVVPQQNRITTNMSSGRKGTFRVDWSVLSDEDGHPTSGSFTFIATGGEPCPGAEPSDPPPSSEPSIQPSSEPSVGETTEPTEAPKGDGGGRKRTPEPSPGSTEVAVPSSGPSTDIAQPTPTPVPQQEDLPMNSVITALVVSLVIGAGGGFVYNGLMGPR